MLIAAAIFGTFCGRSFSGGTSTLDFFAAESFPVSEVVRAEALATVFAGTSDWPCKFAPAKTVRTKRRSDFRIKPKTASILEARVENIYIGSGSGIANDYSPAVSITGSKLLGPLFGRENLKSKNGMLGNEKPAG